MHQTNDSVTLIIPPHVHLFEELNGSVLFGYYPSYSNFLEVSENLNGRNNVLRRHIIDFSGQALSLLPLQKTETQSPIYLYAESIGDLFWVFDHLDLLRSDYHIVLPSDHPNSYTSLKLLSSLGINCGIELAGSHIDWAKLEQLAGYVVNADIPRGKLEPFSFILENYDPKEYLNFNIPLLSAPLQYIYVDEEMNAYPSLQAMKNGQKIGSGKEWILDYPNSQTYRDLKFEWKDFFTTFNPCSTCPAFRICLGNFAHGETDLTKCKATFTQILEWVEKRKGIAYN